ncbi:SRPBCC family protein [Streptomyces litchfieldiae]|uniref:SRPBCC family protein n=1 Tax=Streptomyces litchfieldiae TaxID=3075543 RepID=A0ABU2MRA2_9ACTN|nr:SRPBCC family protein [Streptomyces sp. DSM 44938]MDT0344141.1 SRPBCC family protein [Streptomyces sp. DSM 44938]
MTDALPQQPVGGALERSADGRRWSLTLERELAHPVEDVWAALTEAERVARWAPFLPGRDLDAPGEVALPVPGEKGPGPRGEVTTLDPPRLLALTWDQDGLRFALTPTDTGTRLELTHTFAEQEEPSSFAAGWHLCLAALAGTLYGLQVPRVVGESARAHGWEQLRDQYEDLFTAG